MHECGAWGAQSSVQHILYVDIVNLMNAQIMSFIKTNVNLTVRVQAPFETGSTCVTSTW